MGATAIEKDIFPRQLEITMLNSLSLCGVPSIRGVFLQERDGVFFERVDAALAYPFQLPE